MVSNLQHYFQISEHGINNKKVTFIYGGWKFGAIIYKPLITDLVRRGYRCVLYIPRADLISIGMPYGEIVTAAHLAADDAINRVSALQESGIISFAVLGVSLGTIFAMKSAKKCPEIKKVALFAPFGDFEEHVKYWPKHKIFGKVLASQPTTQAESGRVLNQVGLHKELNLLKGKKVLLGIATNDNSIHTHVSEKLAQMLMKEAIDFKLVKVRGSHATGIFKNLFLNRIYSNFLTKD